MADGTGPGRVTTSGVTLAALLFILIIISLWLFIAQPFWFPSLASVHGADIDFLFMTVLIVSGIAFVAVQGVLGYFIARYGENGERAAYWHDNPKAEAILLISTAVILTVLVFMGQRVWASIYFSDVPANALTIHITGEQFQWNFHYPGPDGVFGRLDNKLITTTNNIGLDRDGDPAAKDDLVVLNEMHVPAGRPVRVRLRSKDVTHSFFLPNLRVKQDAVPGMAIEIWFTPNRPGRYEIACAELCGLGHYRMRADLTVDESEEAFNTWLRDKAVELGVSQPGGN
ncbi:MAG: cytochrome c oxidase subunit II [Acidobacteria bacterium]|nr:cytochrome c oxidase subunit II [Acidobacteriota bacterium]